MNDDILSPQSLSIEPLRRDRITAISSAVQRRPIVLVLGMHRSGTSLCSHILSALGVDLSDDIDVNPSNAGGHWERREIVEFHDRILGLFNRDYLGRFHDFALPVSWWADPRVAQIRREIVAFLEQRMGDSYFGFKDPRTVRLMPVWHQIFNQLKLAPRVVLCLRSPVQVARSLQARDRLDPDNGEYRWLVHMIDFYRYTSKYNFCTIEYEEWFRDPSANIEKLQGFLNLPWQQSEADLGLVLSGLINPAFRHDDSNHREASLPLVRTLYKLARDTDGDEAREKIGYIVSQFISFQQLQGPFQHIFEEIAETAAKFPETEREAAALRLLVNERDAGVASAEARASAAEARLMAALAENEAQQVRLADFTRDQDGRAEIDRELNELRVTLSEREKALSERSRRAEELDVALQAAQSRLTTHETALRRAEQEAQEQGATALARQGEISALRESLAQAERTGQERADDIESLTAEVATLRETLLNAERALRERAEAAESLAVEVRTLRERLAEAERETQERAEAAESLAAEVTTLRETLLRAERAVRERAEAAESLAVEVRTLQERLAEAERETQERAADAESLAADVRTLRETLLKAERETQTRAAASMTLQAEVRTLRERLAAVERETQERTAALGALRAEIATLQATLSAARQVGKAAIAAFRIEAAAPTKSDSTRRWRRGGMMWFFGARTGF